MYVCIYLVVAYKIPLQSTQHFHGNANNVKNKIFMYNYLLYKIANRVNEV